MLNIVEIKCTNKESYDALIEDCKAKGLKIIERGSFSNGEWYFKYKEK